MSWVRDGLILRQEQQSPTPRGDRTPADESGARFAWEPTWEAIGNAIRRDLAEFNAARGTQFQPMWSDLRIQVIPKQPPFDTVVLEVDEKTGILALTCPIARPGLPRRGTFEISGDRISSRGDFVGEPKPMDRPMTVEEFSELILRPLLFPESI